MLSMDWTYEDMETDLNEEDEETVKHCQSKWGYFIKYDYLFSTWYKKLETDFNVSLVTDALSAFTRNIDNDYQSIYKDIAMKIIYLFFNVSRILSIWHTVIKAV